MEEGDSVCLLGRNGGVGKSTTLKCVVGGQLSPEANATTKGNIVFDGTELVGMPAFKIARLGIGYVPQGRRIFPTLSVKENLMIAERSGVNGEKRWDLEQVYNLFPPASRNGRISRVLLFPAANSRCWLSLGGLMQNPKLLILDEITEGLAPIIVEELIDVVKRLRGGEGVTILLAEQSIKFALAVSRKCYIIEKALSFIKAFRRKFRKKCC